MVLSCKDLIAQTPRFYLNLSYLFKYLLSCQNPLFFG
jgi:hypothetical protein